MKPAYRYLVAGLLLVVASSANSTDEISNIEPE